MRPESYLVKPEDVRPARPDGTCFYCYVSLGREHQKGCVCRRKTVVIDFTVRLVREVPENWDEDYIESRINAGWWCSSNIIDELQVVHSHSGCLCGNLKGKFVREATEKDEREYGISNRE